MAHSSLAVANEFLHRGRDFNAGLTHMQVQKLVYLGHGWSLGLGNGPLIDEAFEAWVFGPVVRKLYDALKGYGAVAIPRFIRWGDDTPFVNEEIFEDAFEQVTTYERDLLDWVFDKFGKFHAYQLSDLTHQDGSPWHKVFSAGKNRPISDDEIASYFKGLIDAEAAA